MKCRGSSTTMYDSLRFPVSSAGIRGNRLLNTRITHGELHIPAPVHSGTSAGVSRKISRVASSSLPGQNGHAAIARRIFSGSRRGGSRSASSRPPSVNAKLLPRTSTTYEITPLIGFLIQTREPSRISHSIGIGGVITFNNCRRVITTPSVIRDARAVTLTLPIGSVIQLGEDGGPGNTGTNRGLAIRIRGHQPFFWLYRRDLRRRSELS